MLVPREQPEGVLRGRTGFEAYVLREGSGTTMQGHHRLSHALHDGTIDKLEEPNSNGISRERVEVVPHPGEKFLRKALEDEVLLWCSSQGVELEGE